MKVKEESGKSWLKTQHSGSLWWIGRPGVLRFMGSQRVRHNWATELKFPPLGKGDFRVMITRIENKWLGQIKLGRTKSQFKSVLSRWLIPWWNWTSSEPSNRSELVKQFSEWSTREVMGANIYIYPLTPIAFSWVVTCVSSLYICIYLFNLRLITLQYCSGFCYTLTWISHGYTFVPHPISQGSPSTLALSALSHASNLDWQSISHMLIYMFQCYSLKSSHPHLLPQSPNVCSLSLCLFCYLTHWVIISIFLHSIYICINIQYWCFSFWLTSLCIIGSSFTYLIRTDSNVLFLMAE